MLNLSFNNKFYHNNIVNNTNQVCIHSSMNVWDDAFMEPFEATHDIAVTNVASSKTVVGQGYNVSVEVTVENQGSSIENFDITVYANITSRDIKPVTITGWGSTTVIFISNTAGFLKDNYILTAYAWSVQGETDTGDNILADRTVTIVCLGDLNNDGVVDMADVVLVTAVYRSRCGEPEYRPNSDIIEDCVIDIADVVAVTAHYREVC